MPEFPGFVGPTYAGPSVSVDAEQCINLFPERAETPNAKRGGSLVQVPGLETIATASEAPGRAFFAQDGRAFAVVGFALYELTYNATTDAFTLTLRGTLENDGDPATISSSGDAGDELFITSGGKGYQYVLSTDVVTERLASGSNVGAYLGGYFISLNTSTSAIRFSDLLDGATWNPAQVALRTAAPDRWLGMKVVHDDLFMFGSETSEVWRDFGVSSPAYPVTFAMVPGSKIEQGLGAAFSVAKLDQAPIWLSQNEQGTDMVVRGNGYGVPTRISNHAMEATIQTYDTRDDAIGFTLQYQGHSFYGLTFPDADRTWVYDASTGQWSEWRYWDVTNAEWHAYRPLYHVFAFGHHLALDRQTGAFYRLSATTYTDAGGAPLRRVRRVPFPSTGDERVILDRFQLDADAGVGLVTGQGSDPQVMLRISRDGGRTWGHEHWTTLGAIGEYWQRVVWRRLGSFRGRLGVVEVVVTDPVPLRIAGATFEARRGRF